MKGDFSYSEWNEIIITFAIYGSEWAQKELLPKMKNQGLPVPYWAINDPRLFGEGK